MLFPGTFYVDLLQTVAKSGKSKNNCVGFCKNRVGRSNREGNPSSNWGLIGSTILLDIMDGEFALPLMGVAWPPYRGLAGQGG